MRDSLPGLSESESGVERPIKLLIDENIGLPIGKHIAGILSFHPTNPPVIDFVVNKFGAGVKDPIWIPQIAGEGWVVVSTDRASRCGGPKLPRICAAYGVTHLLFSETIHKKKQFEKATIFLSMWEEIEKLKNAARGSAHRLLIRHKRLVIAPDVRRGKKKAFHYPPDQPLPLDATGHADGVEMP